MRAVFNKAIKATKSFPTVIVLVQNLLTTPHRTAPHVNGFLLWAISRDPDRLESCCFQQSWQLNPFKWW